MYWYTILLIVYLNNFHQTRIKSIRHWHGAFCKGTVTHHVARMYQLSENQNKVGAPTIDDNNAANLWHIFSLREQNKTIRTCYTFSGLLTNV